MWKDCRIRLKSRKTTYFWSIKLFYLKIMSKPELLNRY